MTPGRLRGFGLAAWGALAAGVVVLGRPTPWSVSVGFLFAAAGEAMRVWAAGYHAQPPELVTAGPYRHTRNPLFFGRLLVFAGLCIMAPLPRGSSWALLAAGWAILAGYALRREDRVESERLRARYGDAYERYRRDVPALIPRLRPYDPGGTAPGWSSDRLVRNREPWMLLAVVMVTLFLLWRAYRPQPVPAETLPESSAPAADYFGDSSNWSAWRRA